MKATAAATLSRAEQRTTLGAFQKAIRRESHTLNERPELLWQQLANRLQWADAATLRVLEPELARRTATGGNPWLQVHNASGESDSVLLTLAGHTKGVNTCAFSPDGASIVSASSDFSLRLWDATTGAERLILTGHAERVTACAFSPDGRFIVSAGWDRTLKIWDAVTGAERDFIVGHTDAIRVCAFTPDGQCIVSASDDGTLRVWDAATGEEPAAERAFIRLPGILFGAAVHPWQPAIACGGADSTLYRIAVHGLPYGPLILTAVDWGQGASVRCPVCRHQFAVTDVQIGKECACPAPGCPGQFRLNPFVVHRLPLLDSTPVSAPPPDEPSAIGSIRNFARRFVGLRDDRLP